MDNSVDDARINTYWKLLSARYYMLCMSVYSILSIVTAPKVEFVSVMNSVLREYTTRLSAQHGNYQVLLKD